MNNSDEKAKISTCPMHPEVTSDKPGSCPKCGMGMVPTEQKTRFEEQGGLHLASRYQFIIAAVIIAFATGALLFGGSSARSFLPFAIILLLCPIVMMFMMRGKH